MGYRAVLLVVAAAIAAGTARATQPPVIVAPENGSGTLFASPSVAGARPVTLTLRLGSFPLVCGRPSGSLAVAFPAAVRLPRAVAATAVRLNGAASGGVVVRGHTAAVAAVRPKGVSCQSIVLGRLTVFFTRAADIGNPASSGSYAITIRHGTKTYRATLTIS